MICAWDAPVPSHLRMSQTVIRKSRMQGCPDRNPGMMVILESRLSTEQTPTSSTIMARTAEPAKDDRRELAWGWGEGEGEKKGLTYAHMGMYCWCMARAATTSDAFNAVAEPRRREILNYLALQERPVSKHLRVLLEVGLVNVRRDGRRMLYRTNAEAIRPLHEWTETFERFWRHQLSRVKERAERRSEASKDIGTDFIPRRK